MQSNRPLKVWLTGAAGQVGTTILRHYADVPGIEWLPSTHNELDLTDERAVRSFFYDHRPDVVLNTAAYTQVDLAESHSREAYQLNRDLPALLASLVEKRGGCLFHLSTDHLFGGDNSGRTIPYSEEDEPSPANLYAESKRAGEVAIRERTASAYIWRTAWLYSPYGRNFYRAIQQRASAGAPLRVVTDEVGSPTSVLDLSAALISALLSIGSAHELPYGTYHYTNTGVASRYDFARAILQLNPSTASIPIEPCLRGDLSAPAQRPAFAALDTSLLQSYLPSSLFRSWQEALAHVHSIANS